MPGTTRTDVAFTALADPTRREIVALLARRPRAAGALVGHFALSQPAISRHLRILRESGIVAVDAASDDRRSRTYRLQGDGLERLERWMAEMRTFWDRQLSAFADHVAEEDRRTRDGRER